MSETSATPQSGATAQSQDSAAAGAKVDEPTNLLVRYNARCVLGIVAAAVSLAAFGGLLAIGIVTMNVAMIVAMSIFLFVCVWGLGTAIYMTKIFATAPFARNLIDGILESLSGRSDEESKELEKLLHLNPSTAKLFENARALAAFKQLYEEKEPNVTRMVNNYFSVRQKAVITGIVETENDGDGGGADDDS